MTIGAVVDFLEATGSNQELKAELVQTLGVGDGDVSTKSALDENEISALLGHAGVDACSLAARNGHVFSISELHAVIGAFRSLQSGDISEDEMVSMLGLPSLPSTHAQEAVVLAYRGIPYSKAESENGAGRRKLDVVRFVEVTGKDEDLRSDLQSILEAGDGDISDFSQLEAGELQALRSTRGSLVADFAAKHGYFFTVADLYSIVDAFQRMRIGDLSQEAFERFINVSSESADFLPFIDSVAKMTYKGVAYDKVKPNSEQGNSLEVVRFIQKSHDDESLRLKLQEIIGGDGDISSPEELDSSEAMNLVGERSALVVSLAASEGFRFTISDLSSVVGAFKLVEKGDLSLESCQRILGIAGAIEGDHLGKVGKTAVRIYRGVPILNS